MGSLEPSPSTHRAYSFCLAAKGIYCFIIYALEVSEVNKVYSDHILSRYYTQTSPTDQWEFTHIKPNYHQFYLFTQIDHLLPYHDLTI